MKPVETRSAISIKTGADIQAMRKANAVVGKVLKLIAVEIHAGKATRDLDRFAENLIQSERAEPAFKGYHGFPASLCISVNEEVVHGIPGARVLKDGDIVSVDVGAIVDGFYGDGARTFAVGAIADDKRKLIDVTRQALDRAITMAKPGNRVTDISYA